MPFRIDDYKQVPTDLLGLDSLRETLTLTKCLIYKLDFDQKSLSSDRYNTILIGLESYSSWLSEELSVLSNVKKRFTTEKQNKITNNK